MGPDSQEPQARAKSVDSLWLRAPNEAVWVTTPAPVTPPAPVAVVAPPAPVTPVAPPAPVTPAPVASAPPVAPPRAPIQRPVPAGVAAALAGGMSAAPTATLTAAPTFTAATGITAAPSVEPNGSGRGAVGVADLLGTSTPTPPPLGGKAKASGRGRRWLIEWALVILVAVGVAFGIRTFVVQTFFIPSGSMEPTLMVGDRILVDKLSYHLHAVHRGDIVVFAKPPGENDPNVSDLVKRVIGLPGDTISSEDGRVDIDGKPLSEPWLPAGTVTTGIQTMTVPPNEYFVMGDNRSDSQDSRFFGPISRSLIVGRVVLRIWPVSHFHIF